MKTFKGNVILKKGDKIKYISKDFGGNDLIEIRDRHGLLKYSEVDNGFWEKFEYNKYGFVISYINSEKHEYIYDYDDLMKEKRVTSLFDGKSDNSCFDNSVFATVTGDRFWDKIGILTRRVYLKYLAIKYF